jgi:Transposase IS66 family
VEVPRTGAPYDTYTGPDHQLCCAHALRELQAVTDVAPDGQWCWATQAAEALTAMQDLVREAISQGHHGADPVAKLRQKTSGSLHTLTGARQFCVRRSYLSTAANTASASSTPSSCSPKTGPGCLPPPHQTTNGSQLLDQLQQIYGTRTTIGPRA